MPRIVPAALDTDNRFAIMKTHYPAVGGSCDSRKRKQAEGASPTCSHRKTPGSVCEPGSQAKGARIAPEVEVYWGLYRPIAA